MLRVCLVSLGHLPVPSSDLCRLLCPWLTRFTHTADGRPLHLCSSNQNGPGIPPGPYFTSSRSLLKCHLIRNAPPTPPPASPSPYPAWFLLLTLITGERIDFPRTSAYQPHPLKGPWENQDSVILTDFLHCLAFSKRSGTLYGMK